jgi:hypothetical protein
MKEDFNEDMEILKILEMKSSLESLSRPVE